MGATISDIAKKVGVSKTTVSRVLNNSGYVGEETREKIQTAMKELNYTPNAAARSLSKRETNVIGVMIPEADNPFFGEVLRGITKVADKHNLNIILCNTNNSEEKEKRALRMLKEQRIKGLIITPVTEEHYKASEEFNNEFVRLVDDLHVPVVLVDRELDYVDWDGVFIDNIKGAYEGVDALIQEGHKKIAIITGDLNLKVGRDRFTGYKKAFTMNGLTIDEKYVFEGDFSLQKTYDITKKILKMEQPPTAIFTCNNMTSLGCLKALFKAEMKIPHDISIVGFDEVDLLEIFNLHISVIARDTIKMGKIAMELLLDRLNEQHIDKHKNTRKIILSPELKLKGSEKKTIK